MKDNQAATWLKVEGTQAPVLALELEALVQKQITDKKFSVDNIQYIRDVDLSISKHSDKNKQEKQELLRRLCQLYHVDLNPEEPKSHRKLVGPVIVFAKKLISKLIRPVLARSLRQQRDFNAAVVRILAEITRD